MFNLSFYHFINKAFVVIITYKSKIDFMNNFRFHGKRLPISLYTFILPKFKKSYNVFLCSSKSLIHAHMAQKEENVVIFHLK